MQKQVLRSRMGENPVRFRPQFVRHSPNLRRGFINSTYCKK